MLPIDAAAVSDAVIGKGYTSGQPAGEVQHPTSREADPKEDPMVEQALSMLDLEYQRCIAAEAAGVNMHPALGTEDIAEATEAAEAAGYGAIGSIPCAFSDDDDDDNDEDGGFATLLTKMTATSRIWMPRHRRQGWCERRTAYQQGGWHRHLQQ